MCCVCVCVCLWGQQRERWHIRPEGTSLLESLSPPPSSLPHSLPIPLYKTLFVQSQGRSKNKQSQLLYRSFRMGQHSSCTLIRAWYNAIFLCKYSHINSFHSPLKVQRVRSFTSLCPSTIQPNAGFYDAAKCGKSLWLNGNLVGINST